MKRERCDVSDDTLDPIVVALRDERKDRGWSQRRLARQLHIGQATLAGYERGKSCPSLRIVRRWAAALGLEPTLMPTGSTEAAS